MTMEDDHGSELQDIGGYTDSSVSCVRCSHTIILFVSVPLQRTLTVRN